MPGAHVSRLRVKAFKSVGGAWLEVPFHTGLSMLVGASAVPLPCMLSLCAAVSFLPHYQALYYTDGCGKSTLLDALRFAAACPATSLGVGRLADLHNSDCDEVLGTPATLLFTFSRSKVIKRGLQPCVGV